ncbi:MAG: LUD domain-containing protein [Bacteroidales bacterium]|nr:LUD domain-containing protein [Bacteroidales bacterium]
MKQHEIIEIREKVLKKIRNALLDTEESSSLLMDEKKMVSFVKSDTPLPMQFAENFTEAGGMFYFAESQKELKQALNSVLKKLKFLSVFCSNDYYANLIMSDTYAIISNPDDLPTVQAVISECEFLCARTGSILMSSYLSAGRRGVAMNDALIIIAKQDQVLPDIEDALRETQKKYNGRFPSQLSFVTGPSRTADIEKQLVLGAHGSKRVFVFIYDE